MTSSPSLTTAPLPLFGQSGIGWSIRRPSPGRPGDGRHDQLGNFQTALLGRITPASTGAKREPVLAAWGYIVDGRRALLHLMAGSKEDAETVIAHRPRLPIADR